MSIETLKTFLQNLDLALLLKDPSAFFLDYGIEISNLQVAVIVGIISLFIIELKIKHDTKKYQKKSENLIDFETACLNAKGLKIFCNEFESNYHLNKIDKSYLNQHNVSDISIFIGPVSGYHDTEILFAKQNDFISVSLGSRVLRTETAAIVSVGNIVNQLS